MRKFIEVWPWLVIALLIVVADQWSKIAILNTLSLSDHIVVIPDCFNLVLTYNQGAAFGFLSSQAGWQRYVLLIFALGVSIWLIWMIAKSLARPLLCFSLALVLGGAIGNLIDRIRLGAVVDFIDWYIGTTHWPAFNIADVAITVGVVLLLIESFVTLQRISRTEKAS